MKKWFTGFFAALTIIISVACAWGEGLPVTVLTEITASTKVISDLQVYQSKDWGIGLNGDSLAPDGFLKFFALRQLPFAYYVRNVPKGVNIGDSTAYQTNINTIKGYIRGLVANETAAVNAVIAEMALYKKNFWGIGLNADTLQPDGFVKYFVIRDLPFAYFVRSRIILGQGTAYDQNIATLQTYLKKLPSM